MFIDREGLGPSPEEIHREGESGVEGNLEPEPAIEKEASRFKVYVFTLREGQGKIMNENLGGKLIILPGEGHMGSTSYKQPYPEFPMLLDLIM